ncbi:T9SS type A sorting domain-containing protein [Lewinella sp. IMCC34191]|uniref:T9SS type A sorting domain-containing protein n=1 Tax=Lewinella sp. IMCC34191 TaxID=2259172 RepID=UPI000E284E24|nr:T9SS type A sorting domain-containing protein [Lewinella sp. IMCC34191]
MIAKLPFCVLAFTLCLTAALTAQSAYTTNYWLEAECAEVGQNWDIFEADAAAGGAFVASQFVSRRNSPADIESNRVRFQIDNADPTAVYTVYARVEAVLPVTDSYYVRINDDGYTKAKVGSSRGPGFKWLPITVTQFTGGSNTIDFAYRESNTRLDKIYVTSGDDVPEGIGPVTGNCRPFRTPIDDYNIFWLEAECGIVGSSWRTVKGDDASNGAFVVAEKSSIDRAPIDVPSNYIRFTLSDVIGGGYRLWMRSSGGGYFIRVNGGKWSRQNFIGGKTTGFRWLEEGLPRGLKAGDNTIDIAFRSQDFTLDKILLTRYNLTPTLFGGLAPSCDLTPYPTPSAENTFFFEGECGEMGEVWETILDSGASQGQAAVVKGPNSTDVPPIDEPDNLLRFNIDRAEAGDYSFFARIKAPTGFDDSFWFRVNGGEWYEWWMNIQQGDAYNWNQIRRAIYLNEGVNTIDFTFRENGTILDKIYFSKSAIDPTDQRVADYDISCNPDPDAAADQYLSVECAAVGDTWFTGGGVAIATENSIVAPPEDIAANRVRFTINSEPGNYSIFALTRAFNSQSNSFWVRIDDGEWLEWSQGIKVSTSFEWNEIPLAMQVNQEAHYIDFAFMEAGTWLKGIFLTQTGMIPDRMDFTESGCGSEIAISRDPKLLGADSDVRAANPRADITLFPNPVTDRLNLAYSSVVTGELTVTVIDNLGRNVYQTKVTKEDQLLRSQVPIHNLEPGQYYLRIQNGQDVQSRAFLKQ